MSFTEGVWRYRGLDVKNLSRSETIDLSLKLIEAQGKTSNVVVVDNAEMFDKETIKRLSLNTKGTSFLLMKVGEAFNIEGSKTIELKKQEEIIPEF